MNVSSTTNMSLLNTYHSLVCTRILWLYLKWKFPTSWNKIWFCESRAGPQASAFSNASSGLRMMFWEKYLFYVPCSLLRVLKCSVLQSWDVQWEDFSTVVNTNRGLCIECNGEIEEEMTKYSQIMIRWIFEKLFYTLNNLQLSLIFLF